MDDATPPGVPFDEDTWRQLPDFLGRLPEPVCLHVWGDAAGEPAEREATRLVATLAERFPLLSYRLFPRRDNYPYYPVIGVMGLSLIHISSIVPRGVVVQLRLSPPT